MGASARLYADDVIGGQGLAAYEKLHVLAGENVVRDDAKPIVLAHHLAERMNQRRLAGADGATDADAKRALAHDRNNREWRYCCAIAEMSIDGANDWGRPRVVMASTTSGTRRRTSASR